MEDDIRWKTTFDGRHPLMEDDILIPIMIAILIPILIPIRIPILIPITIPATNSLYSFLFS